MDTKSRAERDRDRPEIDLMEQPKRHMLPVRFFIGVILVIYGILIFATGIYELNNLPDTVLANLHAPWRRQNSTTLIRTTTKQKTQ